MTEQTIFETAKAYEPKRIHNIAELEAVSVNQVMKTELRRDKDNVEYEIKFLVIDGIEFRIPNSVLEQLQAIISEVPNLKTFRVNKKGEGLNTTYTVIQLE